MVDKTDKKNDATIEVELLSAKKTISSLKASCTIRQKKIVELEREIERRKQIIVDLQDDNKDLRETIDRQTDEIERLKQRGLKSIVSKIFHL